MAGKMDKCMSYLPSTFLTSIIIFLYVIFMLVHVPSVVNDMNGTKPGDDAINGYYYPHSELVHIIVINVLMVMVLTSFVKASVTHPGNVPSEFPWDPDCPDPRQGSMRWKGVHLGVEKKLDGRTRFCRICGRYKPDRTHHCRMMQICVLEMDHYCPWIRNCVGFYNKKYFVLLLFYGSIVLISYSVAMLPRFLSGIKVMHSAIDFLVIFAWILATLIGTGLFAFFIFHCWLLSRSYTTIEFCEKRNAPHSKRNAMGKKVREIYSKSVFDLGTFRNFQHVMGPNPMLWLIPTLHGRDHDGLRYEVNEEHALAAQERKNQQAREERSKRDRAKQEAAAKAQA